MGQEIFNRSSLSEKIEDGSLGLLAPESLDERGPDLRYFLLGDDDFALMPWMVKLYSRRPGTMRWVVKGCQGLSQISCLHVWCCTAC